MAEKLKKGKRPNRDEVFMLMAMLVAKRSVCLFYEVGCVIVDEEGHVLSTGYNGPPVGQHHCTDFGCAKVDGEGGKLKLCRGAHAEINAIAHAYRDRLKGATAYCTLCPCNDCMKSLVNAGISRVVFLEKYERVLEGGEKTIGEPEVFELAMIANVSISQHLVEDLASVKRSVDRLVAAIQ